uniref:Doublecortin domain containing 2C n=1 Tax=Rousettus aegyptiacus TaxID=9407 RepID=A0A7J8FFK6_ROUAE|nr:doublecortin domain containing 2C [Rousettus aegyptiacus]
MGARRPSAPVDTTPTKTILVYRNGDPFFEGRKFVLERRRVPTFEALLQQLTELVAAPFGVRRLFTPTHGHLVLGLDALLPGGKYVAAGPEHFRKLDYIHIVPRKPVKMKKSKEIVPVVHRDMHMPSRWRSLHHLPQCIQLFTINGRLLHSVQDLQDKHFYVAAGLEAFKSLPYLESPGAAAAAPQTDTDTEKDSQKKKEDARGGSPHEHGRIPLKAHESVYYAKKRHKKMPVKPSVRSRAEGDVYKAQAPHLETRGAPEVPEEQDEQVEVPGGQDDQSQMSFKKRLPVRHSTKGKASLKKGRKMKKAVPFPEKEPNDFLDEQSTPALLKTPGKVEDHREPPMGQQSQESSLRPPGGRPEGRESLEESPLRQPSQEQASEEEVSLGQSSWVQTSQEQIPSGEEPPDQPSLGQPSQEQVPHGEGRPDQPSLGQPSQEQLPEEEELLGQSSWVQTSQEQVPDGEGPPDQPSLGKPSPKQTSREEQTEEQIP